jgi:hypothetical protein
MQTISLREQIKLLTGKDVPISGGYGTSFEDAVIIEIPNMSAVFLEKYLLGAIYHIRGVRYEHTLQSLIHKDEKTYDVLTCKIMDKLGDEEKIYFDITQYWGNK